MIRAEATILMGHGSQHYAFTAYAALDPHADENTVYINCVNHLTSRGP